MTGSLTGESNGDVVALNDEESQAVGLLGDEIMQDQCAVYAKEDAIKEDKLKEYLEACVQQLKAEATMIEPEFKVRSEAEIQTQCTVYATEDKVKEEKLKEYMDLCAEQLRAEDTMVEPEPEEDARDTTLESKPEIDNNSKNKPQEKMKEAVN
jgi:hypothetical protein